MQGFSNEIVWAPLLCASGANLNQGGPTDKLPEHHDLHEPFDQNAFCAAEYRETWLWAGWQQACSMGWPSRHASWHLHPSCWSLANKVRAFHTMQTAAAILDMPKLTRTGTYCSSVEQVVSISLA
jgi:hypothetical protein